MNCTCGVEIAAQSSIGGKCARCAAKGVVPETLTLPLSAATEFIPLPDGTGTVHYTRTAEGTSYAAIVPNEPDTTLPPGYAQGATAYEDVKAEYEREIGPVPTVRKKGK